jgi:hypothetical protein
VEGEDCKAIARREKTQCFVLYDVKQVQVAEVTQGRTAVSSKYFQLYYTWEPGSSVSIVSDYGLDDRAIGVRSPAGANDFSSNLCVQTGSEAHPASCTMGTGGPFLGGKARPGLNADHSPQSSAKVKNE